MKSDSKHTKDSPAPLSSPPLSMGPRFWSLLLFFFQNILVLFNVRLLSKGKNGGRSWLSVRPAHPCKSRCCLPDALGEGGGGAELCAWKGGLAGSATTEDDSFPPPGCSAPFSVHPPFLHPSFPLLPVSPHPGLSGSHAPPLGLPKGSWPQAVRRSSQTGRRSGTEVTTGCE